MLENILKSKGIKKIIFIGTILSIGLIVYLINFLVCQDYDKISEKTVLETGWEVEYKGETFKDVDISKFEFDKLSVGDDIILKNIVPTDWEYKLPGLTTHVRHTSIKVWIDDEVIYEYGQDRISQNKSVGSGYRVMDFSEDYKGKELKIQLEVGENNPFKVLKPIYICESKNVVKQIIVDNRIPLMVGPFFIVLSFALTIVALYSMLISKEYIRMFLLAEFSLCMGIWIICYYSLFNLFSMPLYMSSLVEYITLFVTPIPLTAYMFGYTKELKSKIVVNVYKILFGIELVFSAGVIMLHWTNIAHIPTYLSYYHIYLAVWILLTVYILYQNLKKNKGQTKMFLVSCFIVALCIMGDLCDYIAERYTGHSIYHVRGVLSIGIFFFLINILLDLYYDVVTHMMEDKEKQSLIERANTDGLTGLNNHGFCAEYMNKLDEEENKLYSIISLDLNNLKTVNDQFGHLKGDELIKNTARNLTEVFSKKGIVGRLGGDEFLIILENSDKSEIEDLLLKLNEVNKTRNISVAYGYAMATEVDNCTTAKVYQLADERMYVHKKEMKNNKTKK